MSVEAKNVERPDTVKEFKVFVWIWMHNFCIFETEKENDVETIVSWIPKV